MKTKSNLNLSENVKSLIDESVDTPKKVFYAPVDKDGVLIQIYNPTFWFDSLGDCIQVPSTPQA